MANNSLKIKKRIVALHKDDVGYKKIAKTLKLSLTGEVPLRTGLAMVDQRSWVYMLSVLSRGCVWEIDIWVLPALLQRLKGWGGQPVSAQTICHTLHQIGLYGCRPRRKHLLKMMHKKARKQFVEDKQKKDMDYWNLPCGLMRPILTYLVQMESGVCGSNQVRSTKTSVSCLQ